MIVCLACHEERISTLLETASELRFFRYEDCGFSPWAVVEPPAVPPHFWADFLCSQNVELLVCGGVRGCCLRMLSGRGIKVASWITGDVDSVLAACRKGTLDRMLMPGCNQTGGCCGIRAQRRRRKGK